MQISLELMLSHPKDAKAIVAEAHRIVDTYGYLSDVMRLSKFNDWGKFSDDACGDGESNRFAVRKAYAFTRP